MVEPGKKATGDMGSLNGLNVTDVAREPNNSYVSNGMDNVGNMNRNNGVDGSGCHGGGERLSGSGCQRGDDRLSDSGHIDGVDGENGENAVAAEGEVDERAATALNVQDGPSKPSAPFQQPQVEAKPLSPDGQRRHDVGHQAAIIWGFVVLWLVLQVIGVVFAMLGHMPEKKTDAVVGTVSEPIAILVVLLACRKLYIDKSQGSRSMRFTIRLSSRKPMNWRMWLCLLIAMLAFAAVGDLFAQGFQGALDLLGWSQHSNGDEIDQMVNSSIFGLLSLGFVGPVTEELLMRGIVMPNLERYGRIFAIVTSALLFGFIHGDISQGFNAVLLGLVLGWMASEYSLAWSMSMHIFYNLVICEGVGRLFGMLAEPMQTVAQWTFDGVFFFVAIVLVVVNKDKIIAWYRRNRSPKHTYRGWRSPLFIFTLAAFLFFALTRISF
ncbi:type II CAAX endopeptidase family protein [Bifidobacterium sp. ESL0764]|uniref:CPBP family intramembrane glutamic endopeptidase n=1 Tax=Bifidobacterium sp. ESL0764 TaxID=2983228 RepID=UPI0023F98296|nr:type II CAAX endopeptidase family protein [Bifidobacterium sp. ESL0764]WEV65109.1 type II CAAX endopeptidase family protein [Bifidobacterium sp. ESL0764]